MRSRKIGLDKSGFSLTLSRMTRARRRPATRAVALVAAVLTLLGVQLFLPAAVAACSPAEAACCCAAVAAGPGETAPADGCDCSISQPAPAPAADVAPAAAFAAPALSVETVDERRTEGPATGCRLPAPPSRARSAPTQALLETFRI